MTRRHPWTPEQNDALKRWYNRKPLTWIQSVLNTKGAPRTIQAIKLQAQKRGIADTLPRGYGRLVDAHHKRCGRSPGATHAIIQAAKKDGVHKQLKHMRGRPHIAPNAWIDQYLNNLLEEREKAHSISGWWSTQELAQALGVAPYALTDASNGKVKGSFARDVRACRREKLMNTVGRPLRWEPEACERLVARYGRRRAA